MKKWPHVDYFPVVVGLKLTYRYEYGGQRARKMSFEVLSVDEESDGVVTATCLRTVAGRELPEYVVTKDLGKGWVSSSLWGNEFPLPPSTGKKWERPPDSYVVETTAEEIEVPAGRFTECLRVVRQIAGGDGGTEERWYAPGVGLIFVDCRDEAEPYKMRLSEKKLPRAAKANKP